MSGQRDLTPAEAIAFAVDPRNDNGQPDSLHVMAFSYDSDCPNYDDHIGAVIESNGGWWTGETWTAEEAEAKLYPTTAEAQRHLDRLIVSWPSAHLIENPCRCYDGITSDDVDTWTEGGTVDVDGFAEWGPFILSWDGDADPGQPRSFTPQEALDAIHSRLEAYEAQVGNDGLTGRMDRAINTIHSFIKQVEEHGSTDLEWGDPGECWDRLSNDPDYRDDPEFQALMAKADQLLSSREEQEAVIAYAEDKGFGRHYGDPHCIWCLQAS